MSISGTVRGTVRESLRVRRGLRRGQEGRDAVEPARSSRQPSEKSEDSGSQRTNSAFRRKTMNRRELSVAEWLSARTCVAALVLASCSPAWAQTTASILGSILDQGRATAYSPL